MGLANYATTAKKTKVKLGDRFVDLDKRHAKGAERVLHVQKRTRADRKAICKVYVNGNFAGTTLVSQQRLLTGGIRGFRFVSNQR